ncbi:MAG TPA: secondary thiamine-phosphate synthase enzyme YjbQ [Acetobacteraceae bacterium]|nr:secondary thiamine-phosphate synthase enzyme YjbQ [Acetobacteraceae bacterium]
MRQRSGRLVLDMAGQGIAEITDGLETWVAESGFAQGLLTVWCRHTTASLLTHERGNPAAVNETLAALRRMTADLAPRRSRDPRGDLLTHVRAASMSAHLSIPLIEGRLMLGLRQGVYLIEHRPTPQERRLALHLLGE